MTTMLGPGAKISEAFMELVLQKKKKATNQSTRAEKTKKINRLVK